MRREIIYTEDVTGAATRLFTDTVKLAVLERGRCLINLSGGSTPLKMYKQLIGVATLPWDKTQLFWGDERFVPHTHEDSNFGAAKAALLDHIPIPESNVHPWPYLEGDLARAKEAYAQTLERVTGGSSFDLTFLGLGDDAHTASLFPGTDTMFAEGLTTSSQPEGKANARLSLTPSALSRSRTVAFLVSGEAKREALTETLKGTDYIGRYPARAVEAEERLLWMTDIKAALAAG